ncbi:RHS repeat protein [Escherichia coli]|nr:RHS repeat protein [Escherichia coli]
MEGGLQRTRSGDTGDGPEGRVTRYGYDEQGLAVSRTDARGSEVALAHDARSTAEALHRLFRACHGL